MIRNLICFFVYLVEDRVDFIIVQNAIIHVSPRKTLNDCGNPSDSCHHDGLPERNSRDGSCANNGQTTRAEYSQNAKKNLFHSGQRIPTTTNSLVMLQAGKVTARATEI